MPDLLPAAEALAEKRCLVTLRNQPDILLLQPIDARDTLSQEMPLLAAQTTRSFLHVAFPVEAWNVDLSPWDAPPVFGREAFGHGAADTLDWLRSRLMPEVRAKYAISPDAPVILGGYSLAGLFSLWSAAQTDAFAAVAAMSPSVWFPGWADYADAHPVLEMPGVGVVAVLAAQRTAGDEQHVADARPVDGAGRLQGVDKAVRYRQVDRAIDRPARLAGQINADHGTFSR